MLQVARTPAVRAAEVRDRLAGRRSVPDHGRPVAFPFLVTHLPSVLDLQVNNAAFHLSVHVVQVWAGVLMWWQVLSLVPELPRLS